MSKIENYQKNKCAQINLNDGNKVLVSYGDDGVKIFLLNFLSFPKRVVHDFDILFIANLNDKIGYDMSKDIVKILCDELVKASSAEELQGMCIELENNKNFVESV